MPPGTDLCEAWQDSASQTKPLPRPGATASFFPISALSSMSGQDVSPKPDCLTSGDRDPLLLPAQGSFVPMPWAEKAVQHMDATSFTPSDGKAALRRSAQRWRGSLSVLAELNLHPVGAVELEFFPADQEVLATGKPVSSQSSD